MKCTGMGWHGVGRLGFDDVLRLQLGQLQPLSVVFHLRVEKLGLHPLNLGGGEWLTRSRGKRQARGGRWSGQGWEMGRWAGGQVGRGAGGQVGRWGDGKLGRRGGGDMGRGDDGRRGGGREGGGRREVGR